MNKDVIERMCRAALEAPHRNCEATFDEMSAGTRKLWIDYMTAAANVLLDEVLGPVTDGTRGAIIQLLRSCELSPLEVCARIVALFEADITARRARIERPKSPEERVLLSEPSAMGYVLVTLDGNIKCDFKHRIDAEIYRRGLIAHLKEQANG